MKFLLDTNICILIFVPESSRLRERLGQCDEDDLAMSAITFAELARGSWHGKMPPLFVLDAFVAEVPVLPFDHLAAKHYAGLKFKRAGFDRMIAAHALATGLTLITSNQRDFADVPGLTIENWTL